MSSAFVHCAQSSPLCVFSLSSFLFPTFACHSFDRSFIALPVSLALLSSTPNFVRWHCCSHNACCLGSADTMFAFPLSSIFAEWKSKWCNQYCAPKFIRFVRRPVSWARHSRALPELALAIQRDKLRKSKHIIGFFRCLAKKSDDEPTEWRVPATT